MCTHNSNTYFHGQARLAWPSLVVGIYLDIIEKPPTDTALTKRAIRKPARLRITGEGKSNPPPKKNQEGVVVLKISVERAQSLITKCNLDQPAFLFLVTAGCLRHTRLRWVGNNINILMKPANSSTQGQPNPRKIRLKVAFTCAIFPFFPQQNIFWLVVGIGFT